jgi:hypothetical protein
MTSPAYQLPNFGGSNIQNPSENAAPPAPTAAAAAVKPQTPPEDGNFAPEPAADPVDSKARRIVRLSHDPSTVIEFH